MPIRIGFVCPTYKEQELHDYTRRAVLSFFKHTADGVAIVVDDGSVGWNRAMEEDFNKLPLHPGQQLYTHHFGQWGGLTRSWNKGLALCRDLGLDYAIAGNNDVLFTPFWYEGLLHALENGYAMAGPVSNAPGVSAGGRAEVWQYLDDYQLTDDPAILARQAGELREKYLGTIVEAKVNGFFQMAKMQTWVDGMVSDKLFYRAKNPRNSKGQRNRTPLMTLNEDELQARWWEKGWKSAVVPSSFIFHYRAVSRGNQYRRGKWFRLTDPGQGV